MGKVALVKITWVCILELHIIKAGLIRQQMARTQRQPLQYQQTSTRTVQVTVFQCSFQ